VTSFLFCNEMTRFKGWRSAIFDKKACMSARLPIQLTDYFSPAWIFLLALVLLLGESLPAQTTLRNFRIQSYDAHLELRWTATNASLLRVYRSADQGRSFEQIAQINGQDSLYNDWLGPDNDSLYQYYVTAVAGTSTDTLSAQRRDLSDAEFLDMVQVYTFRYFWDFAHPFSGLTRERNTSADLVTMGGSGFGLMAILVGIERGYITREQGLQRLLDIVTFLETADRFYGVYPHWMDGNTGNVLPFSQFDNGGDVVETAFLLQGMLTVQEYFDGNSVNEVVLRDKIQGIWQSVNWNWYRKPSQEQIIYWHWSPEFGFEINLPVQGFNETMMVYILANSSPTQPTPASTYDQGWAANNYTNGRSFYDIQLPLSNGRGGPLFFVHYSYLGLDPRGLEDQYANYFEQGVNQTLINRAWCIDNPGNYEGYGENCWGLTASDDPIRGYLAHEPNLSRDNGTITPTAALSSMPYTPEESIAALKHMYRTYGEELWGPMGFYDAFNPTEDWTASSYLAIDQGPIICMIENYRTGLLWNNFMTNEDILNGLQRIGLNYDSTATSVENVDPSELDLSLYPNPAQRHLNVALQSEQVQDVSVSLLDAQGRRVAELGGQHYLTPGRNTLDLKLPSVAAGRYYLLLQTEEWRSLQAVDIMQ